MQSVRTLACDHVRTLSTIHIQKCKHGAKTWLCVGGMCSAHPIQLEFEIVDLSDQERLIAEGHGVAYSRELVAGDGIDVGRSSKMWPGIKEVLLPLTRYLSRKCARIARSPDGATLTVQWVSASAPGYLVPDASIAQTERQIRLGRSGSAPIRWPLPWHKWSLRMLRNRASSSQVAKHAVVRVQPLVMPCAAGDEPASLSPVLSALRGAPGRDTAATSSAVVKGVSLVEPVTVSSAGQPHQGGSPSTDPAAFLSSTIDADRRRPTCDGDLAAVSAADVALAKARPLSSLRARLQSDRALRGSARGVGAAALAAAQMRAESSGFLARKHPDIATTRLPAWWMPVETLPLAATSAAGGGEACDSESIGDQVLRGVTVVMCTQPHVPRLSQDIWRRALRASGASTVSLSPTALLREEESQHGEEEATGRIVTSTGRSRPGRAVIVIADVVATPAHVVTWLGSVAALALAQRQVMSGSGMAVLCTTADWVVQLIAWRKRVGATGARVQPPPLPQSYQWHQARNLDVALQALLQHRLAEMGMSPPVKRSRSVPEDTCLHVPDKEDGTLRRDELVGAGACASAISLWSEMPRDLQLLADVTIDDAVASRRLRIAKDAVRADCPGKSSVEECLVLLAAPDPIVLRCRLAATVKRLARESAGFGSPIALPASKAIVGRLASVVEMMHPWLSASAEDLEAACAAGATASASSPAAARAATQRLRLPGVARVAKLVDELCANPGLALEILRARNAYSGTKTALGGPVVKVFKHDAFESLAFRLALWPIRLTGCTLARSCELLGSLVRPHHGDLTARQKERLHEFVQHGRITRVALATASEEDRARIAYNDVHGIGERRALKLWQNGLRSVDALLDAPIAVQRSLGLTIDAHRALRWAQFTSQRIPRAVALQVGDIVRRVAEQLLPGVEVIVAGSCRRGQSTSGDIDIILFHPGGPCAIVPALVVALSRQDCGLLVEHLRLPSPVTCVDAGGSDREFPGLLHDGAGDATLLHWQDGTTGDAGARASTVGPASPGRGSSNCSNSKQVAADAIESRGEAVSEVLGVPSRVSDDFVLVCDGSTGHPPLIRHEPSTAPHAFKDIASPLDSAELPLAASDTDKLDDVALVPAFTRRRQRNEPAAALLSMVRACGALELRMTGRSLSSRQPSVASFPARHARRRAGGAVFVSSTDALEGMQRSFPGFHGCQTYNGILQWPPRSGTRRTDSGPLPSHREAPPSRAMRVDIKAWHWSQRGPAMLAYTGNQRFNRGIRRFADECGLHLNDKTLCASTPQASAFAARVGDTWTCHPRECSSEEAVFRHLGLEPRSPEERLVAYIDGLEQRLGSAMARG